MKPGAFSLFDGSLQVRHRQWTVYSSASDRSKDSISAISTIAKSESLLLFAKTKPSGPSPYPRTGKLAVDPALLTPSTSEFEAIASYASFITT